MSSLDGLLDGAVREDASRLEDGSFAEDRFGTVRGRIARRRAARSAGVGGASVLGIGVLAAGAAQVPWGGFVFGGPGSTAAVVCTTTTPDALADYASISSVQTSAGDDTDGSHKSWVIVFGNGGPNENPLVSLHLDGEVLTASIVSGDVQTLSPDADGLYTVMLADGSTMKLEVTADEITIHSFPMPTATTNASAAPRTSVSCETTTPEPSSSATPSASSSADRSPAATPNPNPTANVETGETPFQCGYVFASDESGTDALRVSGAPTTASTIHKVFEQWYGNQAPTTEVGDTGALAYHASVEYDVDGYAAGVLDPVRVTETDKAFGLAFVAVRDHVVIATLEPNSDGATQGMVEDRNETAAPVEAFMWDLAALTPCGSASLEGAEVFAVAGVANDTGTEYSWVKVSD